MRQFYQRNSDLVTAWTEVSNYTVTAKYLELQSSTSWVSLDTDLYVQNKKMGITLPITGVIWAASFEKSAWIHADHIVLN